MKAADKFRLLAAAAQNTSINDKAVRVYAALLVRSNAEGISFPGLETLARDSGSSRSRVAVATGDLAKAGFIVKRQRGLKRTCEYQIIDLPDVPELGFHRSPGNGTAEDVGRPISGIAEVPLPGREVSQIWDAESERDLKEDKLKGLSGEIIAPGDATNEGKAFFELFGKTAGRADHKAYDQAIETSGLNPAELASRARHYIEDVLNRNRGKADAQRFVKNPRGWLLEEYWKTEIPQVAAPKSAAELLDAYNALGKKP